MKNKSVMAIIFATMLALCACGGAPNEKTEDVSSIKTESVTAYTISEEETVEEEEPVEENVGYDKSAITQNWVKDYYVDDWGDPTDDAYIVYETTDGSFSDSAAHNARLTAGIIVDREDLQFLLIKYGRNYYSPIAGISYSISVKDENGNVKTFSAWQEPGDDRVYTEDKESIIEMLKTPGTYSFYFENERFSDTFVFKVNTDNFISAYNGL